ncbi:MAG: hypothetical protein JXJ04_15475 [Spirochaetales bacterium]|nr:hypothetical protein [Spirochaetales bacterium]
MNLTIATSQFPVDADIHSNTTYVVHHMQLAKKNGAKVIHFRKQVSQGSGNRFLHFCRI